MDGKRPARNAALSGFYLGIAWLCGHHEIPIMVSCAAAATWVFFSIRSWRLLRYAALSLVIAGLVSAVQLWPTYEFGARAVRWVGSVNPVAWNDRVPYTIHTIYSLPAKGIVETFLPSSSTYADASPFLGAAAVTLALVGVWSRWRDRRVRYLAATAVLSTLFALGAFTPLHGILYSLSPLLAKARIPARAIHLLDFALAVLAAYGADCVARRDFPRRIGAITAGFGVLLLGTLVVQAAGGHEPDDRLWLTALCALATATVLRMAHRASIDAKFATAVLLGLVLMELHNLSTRFPHRFEPPGLKFASNLLKNRDIADWLRAQPGPVRVLVNDADVPENFGDWHQIEMLQGYLAGVPANLANGSLHTQRRQELFGVTHMVGRQPGRPDRVALFEGASGVKVFSNPGSMPRAWSVHRAIRANDTGHLDRLIEDPVFDFHERAAFLGAPPQLEPCAQPDQIDITRRGTDRVTIRAQMACRGLVILGDSYYPGWRCKVDGRPAEVLEVYGLIRGVVVEAGPHTVDMIYRPLSNLGGAALTLAGVLATLALVRFGR